MSKKKSNEESQSSSSLEGLWIQTADMQIYHWYCHSKKHLFVDPDRSSQCCVFASQHKSPEKEYLKEHRRLDANWIEVALLSE